MAAFKWKEHYIKYAILVLFTRASNNVNELLLFLHSVVFCFNSGSALLLVIILNLNIFCFKKANICVKGKCSQIQVIQ